MSVDLWTPIEEGRFHLRSMQTGENLTAYVNRTHAHLRVVDRHQLRARIRPLVQLAREERKRLQRTAGAPSGR